MTHRSLRVLRVLRDGALAALFVSLGASTLQAQALRLRVTEEASGRPIPGALAEVLDSAGALAARGLLSTEGRRVLRLPAGGRYRVRILRIGFEPVTVAAPTVPAVGMVDFALALPTRRVMLSAITVLGRPVCSRDAFRDPSVASLWTEVRTALATTYLGRADSATTLEARAFRRRLASDLEPASEQIGLPRVTTGSKPYFARTADDLATSGYVRHEGTETVFNAPDELVLMSDRFAAQHCFQVTRGDGPTEGLFGLRFTPDRRRDVNDIAGTLWVDSASAELRFLDFWYVTDRFPYVALGKDRSGGQVLFGRTPEGAWIVSAWRLRMPRFADGRVVSVRSDPDWYEEYGGVVTALESDSLIPVGVAQPYRDLLAPSRVTGVVYDSLSGGPLGGARVWLLPEETPGDVAAGLAPLGGRLEVQPVSRLADIQGRFVIDSLPAGTWRLAFEHSSLDSVGVRTPVYDIRLRPGATVNGTLAVPSLATLRKGCSPADGGATKTRGGMITGSVRAAGDDRALVDAVVRVSWVDLRRAKTLRGSIAAVSLETRTDSLGEFRLCGVADSTEVTVTAAGPHASTGGVRTMVGAFSLAHVNLRLAEVGEGEAAPAPATISGSVTDSAGAPIAGARVSLDGSTTTVLTGAAGTFLLTKVQPGTQTLEVRRVGLEPARLAVDVAPGTVTPVALTLTKAHLLYSIVVTAPRLKSMPGVAEAINRQRFRSGRLLLEDQIKVAPTFESLLQNVSGVRVVPNESGGPWVTLMRRGNTECVARPFVDGREVDYDVVATLKPKDIAALEIFVHAATAPVFTAGRSPFGHDETCGVILIWEKHQV